MMFNEKLVNLRKEGGLTQEDLAYQFNVTTETISKWEQGVEKPEYEKIEEISRFFNTSVEELLYNGQINSNDNVIIEENANNKKTDTKKYIIIIVVIIVVLFILSKTFFSSINKVINTTFGNVTEQIEDVNEQSGVFFDIFSNVMDKINNQVENISDEEKEEIYNDLQNEVDQAKSNLEIRTFNREFEFYEGIIKGIQVKSLLSDVVVNNRKETKILTVVYENEYITDVEQIKNIREKIDSFSEYEVYFEYDVEGYIEKINILK